MPAETAFLEASTAVQSGADAAEPRIAGISAAISVAVTDRLEAVETVWRALAAGGIESPGQSYDFIRAWIADRKIAPRDQVYVVGSIGDAPVALLALHRRRVFGIRVLSWFPGSHVGCNAPLIDASRLAALGPEGRAALWRAMVASIGRADVLALRAVPTEIGGAGLFDELGSAVTVETLYRAQFSSWEECDREQRSRSRRKHDRQQGDRLAALGSVCQEELRNGDDTREALETMFRHRSARFKQMGVPDPFQREKITGFYHDMLAPDSGVDVRLHVMRLDGKIVATRYNVVAGDRMFCLISSMSDDPAIQGGSPGKQCLLRVMQTVFDAGFRTFDMGAGFTDEKRHWCNVQVPLRHHYLPLTPQGRAVAAVHELLQRQRARLKSDKRLMEMRKTLGQWLHKIGGA